MKFIRMTLPHDMKILSLSLGTRGAGVAILYHEQLIHWKTHAFNGRWSESKLKAILDRCERYILEYDISHVTIKIPPSSHHSKGLLLLLKRLTGLVKLRGCLVDCQTKADLKRFVPEAKNAESLMSYIATRHPVLSFEYHRERRGRQRYYLKMFEAVLAAEVYQRKLLVRKMIA